ncbi:HK97 family phage prohead protease [Erysipelotrichaceae bacterium OttesenSCG-928-M19]|nr:HK97 family phage prohead protease [Erysipelotrichaceae bacterium OttesenSCG-928-M19]
MQREKSFVIKELAIDEYKFKGYLSTYGNEDRVGDIIEKGAFDKSINERKIVPMLFNHNRDIVIGKMTLTSDDKGLYVEAELSKNITESVKVYELLKMGALTDMSIGMSVIDYKYVDDKYPSSGWIIKEAEVWEGSVVTIPANTQAKIEHVKGMKSNDDYKKLLIETIKKLGGKN